MSLSKADLNKKNKPELVQMITDLQSELSQLKELNEKVDALASKFDALSSELLISKNVNSLLVNRIKDLEVRCGKSEQYSRRECLEIVGIPASVTQQNLESKVLNIFDAIGAPVDDRDVEACHRIGKNNRTIIKLSKRKNAHTILRNKKKLKDIDSKNLGLDAGSRIYINESLCGMYRGLWVKCKMLHNAKHIHSFYTSNGSIRVKVREQGKVSYIFHDDDLVDLLPQVDFKNLE